MGDHTRVHSKDGRAYFCDLKVCGSVWSCPVCAATIRQRRAVEVERVCKAHLDLGKSVGFLTLTFPHSSGEPLGDLLDTLALAWRQVQNRRAYRNLSASIDLLGFIRATEVTYGRWNGWHPHLHLLLFADGQVSDEEWAAARDVIADLWAQVVVQLGRKRPGDEVGVTLAPVATSGVGQYLAKVQDHYGEPSSIGREMQRGDVKKGRKRSRTPFELLEEAGHGLPTELGLWWEWEAVTKGRRAIAVSTAVRKAYGWDQAADEDLAKAEVGGEQVGTLLSGEYALLVRSQGETVFLDLVEDGGWSDAHAFLLGLQISGNEDAA